MTDPTTPDAETLQRAREAAATVNEEIDSGFLASNYRDGSNDDDRAVLACLRFAALDRAAQSAARKTAAPVDGGEVLRHAFRAVDEMDWQHLLREIPDSGHGRFWKAVFAEVRQALAAHPAQATIPETPVLGERWADDPLVAYLERQWSWSKQTFGPALRTRGIIQHITKELREIEANPHDLAEWVDVMILAMDGFWRHGGKPEGLLPAMQSKQDRNFARAWPDWRTMGEDQAIEHDRSGEAAPAPDQTPPRGGVTVEEIETAASILDAYAVRHGDLDYYGPDGDKQVYSARKRVAFKKAQAILATLSRQSAGAGADKPPIPEPILRALYEHDATTHEHLMDCWLDDDRDSAAIERRYEKYRSSESALYDQIRRWTGRHTGPLEKEADARQAAKAAPPETPPAGSPQVETGGQG